MNSLKSDTPFYLIAAAFEKWEQDYRTNPEKFWNEVERFLGHTSANYGVNAADAFLFYLDKVTNESGK